LAWRLTITTVVNTALSLVLPSGGTLGSIITVQQRLVLVAMNNAGTSELAVISLLGGTDLSETGVINTIAISAGSTSNNVFYSTTARTGLAYRVVGAVDVVNTAGAWGNPVLVQGAGGEALTAMSSLGYGQTWQNVTGSRSAVTAYYNTTGKPITVAVSGTSSGAGTTYIVATVQGVQINGSGSHASYIVEESITFVVPINSEYSVTTNIGTLSITKWAELR
jgi:hypothetical protein